MGRRASAWLTAIILLMTVASAGASRKSPQKSPLDKSEIWNMHAAPQFATAEACTVLNQGEISWRISHWLVGAELYKSLQDPGQVCSGPYPFTVEAIHMILYVANFPCTLYVSVDVESADYTDEQCPVPGELMSISSEYMFILDNPNYNLYQISVPLDSPAVVDGPYFAGFYLANIVDTTWGLDIITDDAPTPCVDYNIWDTTIGFVDLNNTGFPSFPSFPGRIFLYSTGTTGGGGGLQPQPIATLLKPISNEIVTGPLEVWAVEAAGSDIIDSVRFDYRGGGAWQSLFNDVDGAMPLRNGVDPSGTGDGYYTIFDYSTLTEGLYWIKATAFDAQGRTSVDSHQVNIDPTPPDPTYISPGQMDTVCHPITFSASTMDENLSVMRFTRKDAIANYSVPVVTLNQSLYGNNNGNPNDGNHVASGEYGDYYCGPVAAATAIKYWFDKGYPNCMKEGAYYIPVDTVVERMATLMMTRQKGGTYDDLFFYGLKQYNTAHSNQLLMDAYRNPDYYLIRSLFQENERFVILALTGTPGLYLPLTAVNGVQDAFGQFAVTVANPLTGTLLSSYIRHNGMAAQFLYDGNWLDIDAAFTVIAGTYSITLNLIANDNNGADGWGYNWTTSNLTDGTLTFLTTTAVDAQGRTESVSHFVLYDCSASYVKGDYTGDGNVTADDLIMLINFIYKDGPAPAGGAHRGDANCDNILDISDVIFAVKFFYAGGQAPCH